MTGYYFKTYDSWTPPLYYFPRWMVANTFPDLNDRIELPPILTYSLTGSYTSPASSTVPISWKLTTTSSTSGDTLQRLFEAFVNGNEFVKQVAYNTSLAVGFSFDVGDELFGWECAVPDIIEKVEVALSDGSKEVVEKAQSVLDFFYPHKWTWHLIDKNRIIITGLGLQPALTHKRNSSDWLWLTKEAGYDANSRIYLEHPYTRNWFPVHPFDVRSDGMVGFNSPVVYNARTSYPQSGKELTEVKVFINDKESLGKQVVFWNSVDEIGLWYGLYRRNRELNSVFGDVLDSLPKYATDATVKGFTSFLSIALRQYQTSSFAASSTGFSLPSGFINFQISRYKQFYSFSENLYQDSSNNYFRSRAASPLYSEFWSDNKVVTATLVTTGGLYSFNPQLDNRYSKVRANHNSSLWTTPTTGTVVFTESMPEEIPDIDVLFIKNVRVIDDPDIEVKRDAFTKNAPQLKWQTFIEYTNSELQSSIKGSAVFE